MRLLNYLYGGITARPKSSDARLYPQEAATSSREPSDLSCYAGQVVMIVNTASQCGFAKQYDDLEALYQRYKEHGFTILGFPSNDFMGQEPKSDGEIQEFCRIRHGVTFPLFSKAAVKGGEKQSVFSFLTERGPTDLRGEVLWNFEKFLIDRNGSLIGRWRSYVSPTSRSIERGVARACGLA